VINVGVLGGGQLAQMLAQAGIPLGIRVVCIDNTPDPCAAWVTAVTPGDPGDRRAVEEWVRKEEIDVLTYESEFIDAAVVQDLAGCVVHPSPAALSVSQERIREKSFFEQLGIPVPGFRSARDETELAKAFDEVGLPAVVKTTQGGYDGKGQVVVRGEQDVATAAALVTRAPVIVESLVTFQRELSLIAVRDQQDGIHEYPVTENQHSQGILFRSLAPAPDLKPEVQKQISAYARLLMEGVDYVGVMGFEFFDMGDHVLANEFAPRPHNSGHWTIGGSVTSQFENHLRAITGLPVGSTRPLGLVAMMNIIGDVPESDALLRLSEAHLHLYGKSPRRGRKLGHVTTVTLTESDRVVAVKRMSDIVTPSLQL
jgi:5-(carboxyamino)imidazole ribonucleotide synthase